jgi:hypothetical protein
MFFKSNKQEETRDMLVTIDPDSGQADIQQIKEINSERILTHGYSVPIGDTRAYTGRKGRIFVVNAPAEATSDYKRIAELEKSVVLKQITRYKDDPGKNEIDLKFYIVLGGLILMGLILAWR